METTNSFTKNGETVYLSYETSGLVEQVDIVILSVSHLIPVVKSIYQTSIYQTFKDIQRRRDLIELKNELEATFKNPEGIFRIPDVNVKVYNELVNEIQDHCEIGYIIKKYIPIPEEEQDELYTRRQRAVIEAHAKPSYEFDDSLNNLFKF